MERIGFIGIGRIGFPVAKNIADAGFPLVAYDPNLRPEYETQLKSSGARIGASLQDAIADADVIVTLLPTSNDVEEVLCGIPGREALRSGQLCIDMSSGFPSATRRIAQELATRHIDIIDAPICNGGVPGAYAKALTLCVAGEPTSILRARPVLEACSSDIQVVGPIGAGHTMKLVSNYLVLVPPLLFAEALGVGRSGGLVPSEMVAVLQHCAATTFLNLDRLVEAMGRQAPADLGALFRLGLARKDLRYATALAAEEGAPSPIGDAAHSFLLIAERSGYRDAEAVRAMWDFLTQLGGLGTAAALSATATGSRPPIASQGQPAGDSPPDSNAANSEVS